MTPQAFITQWGPGGPAYGLNEEQGAQSHFLDLCALLDVPKPGSLAGYRFEEKSQLIGERTGYADVFYPGHFAWENKAPKRDLDKALKQLLTYSLALSNPPLLVVCDRLTIRIHTHFTGHPTEVHTVLLQELDQPEKQALLRRLWTNPESFRPKKTSRDITEAAAKSFATLAEGLRKRGPSRVGHRPGAPTSAAPEPDHLVYADEVAHFLTQCLFCFFAEDVGLLPGRMFEGLVNNKNLTSDKLSAGLTNLFTVMRNGGMYGNDDIPWFNGGLFQRVKVPPLTIMEVTELRNAAALNWSAIDVSIFGTLFERGLDPAKRSQLGAHYTDPATILRIVEPVLTRPLLQKWELVSHDLRALLAKSTQKKRAAYSAGGRHYPASKGDAHFQKAEKIFFGWLSGLSDFRVLDPACGSGNFLFLGLKSLKDIEHKSHLDAAAMGLDRQADLVTGPHNVLGIELNEYAAELARVTVWIGELQWRIDHGYEFKTNPVLDPLDHIECRDALLAWGAASAQGVGQKPGAHEPAVPKSSPPSTPLPAPTLMERGDADAAPLCVASEAPWPRASVVIGNPPFLGDKKMRSELGGDYTETLRKVYAGRVPGGADLVTYWFEKARHAIETNGLGAAGLVSTQSIRAGANRTVLAAICDTTKIFEAWSDESWVNDGAAVRVSLVCFGHADQSAVLDGMSVPRIPADLSHSADGLDLTIANSLTENSSAAFQGPVKVGAFDVTGGKARGWLQQPNVNGKSNALVLRPWANGQDVTRRSSDTWIVDFGAAMSESDASLFEAPFAHIRLFVKPQREAQNDPSRKRLWWIHGRTGDDYRRACIALPRYIATPRVAKHRFFVWLPCQVWPDSRLYAITRADDCAFGLLSSRIHEVWSLANASMHGVGNDPTYNAKSCFETFPFPAGLTPRDTAHQRTETLESGEVIPAGLGADFLLPNSPADHVERAQAATKNVAFTFTKATKPTEATKAPKPMEDDASIPENLPKEVGAPSREAMAGRVSGAILKSAAYEPPASASPSPSDSKSATQASPTQASATRTSAIAIATAAKRLNDLRQSWLNPTEWTNRVPEVTPLGMDKSPYPDRILPKPGHEKDLAERTLTKLYNQRPAWLDAAHKTLDQAVAHAYGWTDYTADLPDEEILKRLLALNLKRSRDAVKPKAVFARVQHH